MVKRLKRILKITVPRSAFRVMVYGILGQ